MLLKKASIKNIKSYYQETHLDFLNDVNLFVGPNGGGKSNLFEIIQAVINNLIYKHVTIKTNPNRRSLDHPHKNFAFIIEDDRYDTNTLTTNLLEKHYKHLSDPSFIKLTFEITKNDVDIINILKLNKNRIIEILTKRVANSLYLVNLLNKISSENFDYFIGKQIVLSVLPPSLNVNLDCYSDYVPEKHNLLNLLKELIEQLNVFHEIAPLIDGLDVPASTKYIGPHRTISQPMSMIPVNLSTIGNFEDSFVKGINTTQNNTPSFIDASYLKVCQLTVLNKTERIEAYKVYLKKYLGVDITIEKVKEVPYIYEYEIKYLRENGIPMRLSSGEKEFFNLITGLILSEIGNGIVFIDEPELHLHIRWQLTILNLIKSLQKDFNIQFFIVTHSHKFINETTLPNIFRVSKEQNLYSSIVKPQDPIGDAEMKNIVHFINSTNNEKAFFADKVILVEGLSDLIIITSLLEKIKKTTIKEVEVEVLQAGSKYNLLKIKNLLSKWNIDCYIIGDFDYLNEIYKSKRTSISSTEILQLIEANKSEIENLIKPSDDKLKEIICKNNSEDGNKLFKLLKLKQDVEDVVFHKEISEFADYLIKERIGHVKEDFTLSDNLRNLLKNIADKEKILILQKGDIENYFDKKADNKIINALNISKNIDLQTIADELKGFIKKCFD